MTRRTATVAVSTMPHQLINGYIVSTILSKPTKLMGKAIKRQPKMMSERLLFSPSVSFFASIASAILSEAILSEDTSVVNMAPAISTPHTALRLNFCETAKTGIDECKSSAKTTVCSINSNPNRQTQISAQDKIISL